MREPHQHTRPRFAVVLILLVSVLGSALIWISTCRFGPGLTADSASYLAGAASLAFGRGYLSHSGSRMAEWPPLYPALLSVAYHVGLEPRTWARLVNAVGFGLLIWTASLAVRPFVRFPVVALWTAVAVALTPALQFTFAFVWSENLFSLLVLGFIVLMQRFLLTGHRGWLAAAALAAGLAFLTRYIGLAVVVAGVILTVIRGQPNWRRRLGDLAGFSLLSSFLILPWLLRNVVLTDTMMGERAAASDSLLVNLQRFAGTILDWGVPVKQPAAVKTVVLGGLLALVAAACLRSPRPPRWHRASVAVLPTAVFVITYSVLLLASATMVAYDALDRRFLAPVFAPLTALIAVLADRGIADFGGDWTARRIRGLATVLGVGWLLLLARPTAAELGRRVAEGAGGYASSAWMASDLVQYLRAHPPAGTIYTNVPAAVFLFSGRPAGMTPRRYRYRSPETPLSELGRFRASITRDEAPVLIWFHREVRDFAVPLPELERALRLEPIAILSDGAVYRLRPPDR